MTEDPNYLVVYGTLQPPLANPFAHYLRQHSHPLGEVTFPGRLFDLKSGPSTYPGAIYLPDGNSHVIGTVYDMGRHKRAILGYLDDYEGVGQIFDQPNEYARAVIPVRYHQDILDCWVYLYNLPTDGKPVIASGDYIRYSLNE